MSQEARVQQAGANLQKAEQEHAETQKCAYKISEALMNYKAELESLNRLMEEAQKGSQKQTGKGSQSGSLPKSNSRKKPAPEGSAAQGPAPQKNPAPQENNGDPVPTDTQATQAPGSAHVPAPEAAKVTESDVLELETMIKEIDSRIESVGKEERRATKRAKRYKKPARKVAQKVLNKLFGARKPKTVVEEETILADDCHEQLGKLQNEKATLLKKLEEAKRFISEAPPADLASKNFEDVTGNPEPSPVKGDKKESPETSDSKDTDPIKSEEQKEEVEGPDSEQTPKQEDEQRQDSAPQADQTRERFSTGLFSPLSKARDRVKKVQEKIAENQKRLSEKFEEVCLEQRERATAGKKTFAEAKHLKKVAELIDQELAKGGETVSLKTKDGKERTVTREKAQQLKAAAIKGAEVKKADAAQNIVEGSVQAAAAHGAHSATGRLSKEVKTAGTTVANSLGSNAGSAAVDFGARCIQKGGVGKDDAIQAAADVAFQTTKGVLTQVGQNVARSAIKGVVKEVAPELAKHIPGLAAINNTYAVGCAVLSANSVGEAFSNGTNAAVDVGISYGCAAAGQALIPIPFVGAFAGAAVGSLTIRGKNCLVEWWWSEPETAKVTA